MTTPRVLTMEFMHGAKANDLDGIRKFGADPKQLALNGVGAAFQQFLIDGFFHADPHPGNFFAMKNNVLCLHDFGMVGYLTPEQRKELMSCFVAFVAKDIDGFFKHFMHLAIFSDNSDTPGLPKHASQILIQFLFTPNQPSIALISTSDYDGYETLKKCYDHVRLTKVNSLKDLLSYYDTLWQQN